MPEVDASTSKTHLFALLLPSVHFCACLLISAMDSQRGWWYMFYVDFPGGFASWLLAGVTKSFFVSFATLGTAWWLLLGMTTDSIIDGKKATVRLRNEVLPSNAPSDRSFTWRFLLPGLHVSAVAALTLLAPDTPVLDGAWRYLIFADLPISFILVAPLMVMAVPAPLVIGIWGTVWWYLLGRLAEAAIKRWSRRIVKL
jgi:hypothetical protein